MRRLVLRVVRGSSLEGAARRAYNRALRHVPGKLLPPGVAKSFNYDRMTFQIAARTLAGGGSAIDVGANEGEILDGLVKISSGPHWAFEPIPDFAARLRKRFPDVMVDESALSDSSGEAEFHYIPDAAAYSSLLTRPQIEQGRSVERLNVKLRKLDECIPVSANISFVKIDVEGGEAAVIRGGRQLLSRCKPVTVFECASAELPECIAALEGTGLAVSFLADFLAGTRRPAEEVVRIGRERGEYYYVAHQS